MDTNKSNPSINGKDSQSATPHSGMNPQEPLLTAAPEEQLLEAHSQEPLLTAAPEEQLLEAHKEPQQLAAHKSHHKTVATIGGTMANGGDKIPPTSDDQEATGVFRGAGWVALAVLALMVLAACLWPPRFNGYNMRPVATMNPRVAQYEIYEVTNYRTPAEATINSSEGAVVSTPITESAATTASPSGVNVSATKGQPATVTVYLFETDSSTIPETASLTKVANQANQSGKTVVIRAYTDETGNAAYNQRLSERRAKAVGNYMVAHGVPATHIKAKGYGPTHAYANNAQDRRAEISLE